MSAGTYEPHIHQDVLTMEDYFKRVGVATKTSFTHEGHSFGTWRRAAEDMLMDFFEHAR